MQWRIQSGRKASGGKYHKSSKKCRHQRGRDFIPTELGKAKIIKLRTRGGNAKALLVKAETANVVTKEGIKKVKITNVKENPANSQFTRRNIITKGAIIETELGKARVTSRPGQDGSVDAVLIGAKLIEAKK